MQRQGVRTHAGPATVSPTPGNRPAGGRRRGPASLSDAHYLWLLVALEVAAHIALRRWSRSHHGG